MLKLKNTFRIFSLGLLLMLSACNDWLREAAEPNDRLSYEQMNDPQFFGEIQNGDQFIPKENVRAVINQLSEFYRNYVLYSAVMSDELLWKGPNNASLGKMMRDEFDNEMGGTIRSFWSDMQEYLSRADELLKRIDETEWTGENEELIRKNSLFNANFYQGLGEYFLVTFFNREEDGSGLVYRHGEGVQPDVLMNKAIEKLKISLDYGDEYQKRLSNTILARAYLYKREFPEAAAAIQKGLQDGDAPFELHYSAMTDDNSIGAVTGPSATSGVLYLNDEFRAQREEIGSAAIIALPIEMHEDGEHRVPVIDRYAPLVVTSVIEAKMIEIECTLNGESNGKSATTLVNEIIRMFDSSGESELEEGSISSIEDFNPYQKNFSSWEGKRMPFLKQNDLPGEGYMDFNLRVMQWFPIDEIEWL